MFIFLYLPRSYGQQPFPFSQGCLMVFMVCGSHQTTWVEDYLAAINPPSSYSSVVRILPVALYLSCQMLHPLASSLTSFLEPGASAFGPGAFFLSFFDLGAFGSAPSFASHAHSHPPVSLFFILTTSDLFSFRGSTEIIPISDAMSNSAFVSNDTVYG